MKNIAICYTVFLLIYLNRIEGHDNPEIEDETETETPKTSNDSESSPKAEGQTVPIIQAHVPPTKISERLSKIEKALKMDSSAEKVDPTDKEILWINRFVQTSENWLKIATAVSKLPSYQNEYKEIADKFWDECISSDKNPIEVRYRKDVKENDPLAKLRYAYNFIPYWICTSGFGFGSVNVKSLDIHYKQSKKKKKTSSGQTAFRKDKFYDAEVEITVPWIDLLLDHEIIQWGEKRDPDEKLLKDGKMRIQLNNVKITMSLQLQEIDKRFVQENPDTGLTYYFLPDLKKLSLTVNNVQRYNNEIQKKEGPEGIYVGKGISENRGEKIIVDLSEMFESEAGLKEVCERLKPVLYNKSAEAIMVAPDVLSIAKNVILNWDQKEPKIPPCEWDDKEIKLWHQAFYAGHSYKEMLAKALNFMITHMQNVKQGKIEDPNVLGDDPPTNYDVGGLDVHDDGFDYTGVPAKKST